MASKNTQPDYHRKYSRAHQRNLKMKEMFVNRKIYGDSCSVCGWKRHVFGLLRFDDLWLCRCCLELYKAATGLGRRFNRDGTKDTNPYAAKIWKDLQKC
jgi:hypothetical protein